METFVRLFGSLLALVYHCFDRIVICGYLPLLSRPEHIVHFFRDVQGLSPITKEVLRQRTDDYNRWVEAYAGNHDIPVEWAEKGVRKEDYVRPALKRRERNKRCGVYFILKSMELGGTFRSAAPKYPVADPNYRILSRQRSRFTHYYFYIRDETLGPLAVCVASFLPCYTTYYLNGHHFIARELERRGVAYRSDDHSFLSTADPAALPAAAERLDAATIQKRLEYWTLLIGPKFSTQDRPEVNLQRRYSINQVEYCRNFVFRRSFPIHKIFERSCELGLLRLSADKVSQIFSWPLRKRVRGRLETVLEAVEHGHHVLRAYSKKAALRMYQKGRTFLRLEVLSNRLKDFQLNKGLENLEAVRQKLTAATDRFAAFEAEALNTPIDFPLFQRLALPIQHGRSRVPGIKIHDTRLLRLLEVLLPAGTQTGGRRPTPYGPHARRRGVGQRGSTEEATEQLWQVPAGETGGGGCGGKPVGQGERGTVQRGPDAESGNRVQRAASCAPSGARREAPAVHRTAPSSDGRSAAGKLLRVEASGGPGSRRRELGRVCHRAGGSPRRSAQPGAPGRVSRATIETFDFLGFTHIGGKNRKTGYFEVRRKTVGKRLAQKLRNIKQHLRRRMQEPPAQTAEWLRSVVQGYFNYHSIPGNRRGLCAFRSGLVRHWRQVLSRRSQKVKLSWARMKRLIRCYIPTARLAHPFPSVRFDAMHPR